MRAPPQRFTSLLRAGTLLLALLGAVPALRAQEQESVAMQRMLHPDQTLKFNDADRKFDSSAAVSSKRASVHPFLFSHPASTKAGNGVFHTRDFGGTTNAYHTALFGTKSARVTAYSQTDKTYAARAVAVHDDRSTGKTMNTRGYVSSEKPFLVRGKRQDTIDELRGSSGMTIEQVRELLNKNR